MRQGKSAVPPEAFKTDAWRQRFLLKLSRMDGFDSHLARSRETHDAEPGNVPRSLLVQAEQFIKSFSRYELAQAKQYYNNALLVSFWRWFLQELERLSAHGEISREYPVFEVEIDRENLTYVATLVPMQHFGILQAEIHSGDTPWRAAQAELDTLINNLVLVHKFVHQSLKTLFSLFLDINMRAKGAIWDYFVVYHFLDSFLYVASNGQACKAPFDRIFFNSSLFELKLFLEYHFSRQLCLSLSDVDEFLKKQRTHYLRQAVVISLEESEALNHRKDLLRYDETKGVVVMDGFTDEIRRHYQQRKIKPYRLVKLDGCPFARSRGAGGNALLEVYEFSDRLALKLLAHSPEFCSLFGARNEASGL